MELGPLQGRFANAALVRQHQIGKCLLRDPHWIRENKRSQLFVPVGKCVSHLSCYVPLGRTELKRKSESMLQTYIVRRKCIKCIMLGILVPLVASNVCSNCNREELLVSNWLIHLRRVQCAIKPLMFEISAKDNWTCCIRSHFQSESRWQIREKPEANPILRGKKLMPPAEVQLEFPIQMYRSSALWKQDSRSIIRWMKEQPGQTTLAVWWRGPIIDSSWHLLHQRQEVQELIEACRACSLSAGRRVTWLTESNAMSSNTRDVAGPMH